MFDADLVLWDGTINITASTDAVAFSTTRLSTTGGAVIDLGPGGTPASGLSAVLIMPTAPVASSTLTGYIEGSEEVAFGESTYQNHELVKFDIAAATEGVILAAEVPAIVIARFATSLRYVRANLTVNTGDSYNFYKVKVFLTPFPFRVM